MSQCELRDSLTKELDGPRQKWFPLYSLVLVNRIAPEHGSCQPLHEYIGLDVLLGTCTYPLATSQVPTPGFKIQKKILLLASSTGY
jgi:hypothetical protein